ncbi:MAG: glycosyltransferase family 39 protein [Candidatus Gottesmanbacteria bacterium]
MVIRKLARSPIVWLLIVLGIYIISRFINLTALPIFTDEAIYIRWSQIGSNDAGWRFISLTDGKQPFFTWLMMASLRLFTDPLFAGRFVSVIAGVFSTIGLYILSKELFHKKYIGLIASILYVLSPFAYMYDRLAIYDAWVATFSIWNLYLAILLVRKMRLDVALIFGLTLGVGMLNKTSAFLSLYLLPATIVLFDFKQNKKIQKIIKWAGLCVLAALMSQIVYSILRLSPFFYIISQKDALFVYPLREWIIHPFTFFQGNLHGLFDWLINYLTWPMCVVVIASLLFPKKQYLEKLLLIMWWLAPFTALALFGRVLYPRFIFFMTMPLLVLAANFIDWCVTSVRPVFLKWVIIVACCLPSAILSYQMMTDIKTAPIPVSERGQYVSDWPSGWGTNEVVAFLKEESRNKPIAVYTEGTFGLFPYALEIYLWENKNVEIFGLWPLEKTLPDAMRKSVLEKDTYFVSNFTQSKIDWPLQFIAEYQKGTNQQTHMRLYKVELPKEQ